MEKCIICKKLIFREIEIKNEQCDKCHKRAGAYTRRGKYNEKISAKFIWVKSKKI